MITANYQMQLKVIERKIETKQHSNSKNYHKKSVLQQNEVRNRRQQVEIQRVKMKKRQRRVKHGDIKSHKTNSKINNKYAGPQEKRRGKEMTQKEK